MYVTAYSSERRGRATRMTWSGVPVKLNAKSVLLAYPRVWLWFLAFAWPFLTQYGKNINETPKSTWITMGAFVAAAIGSNFLGKLSNAEKARLHILKRVTGMGIDPAKLKSWVRNEKEEFWRKELKKTGLDSTPEAVLAASQGAPPEVLDVLYTYACYAGDGADWCGVASQILTQIPPR